jgi:CHASE2 domain-containing sensor protein
LGHSLLRAPAFQIGVISLLVFLGVIGLRWEGYLESAELDTYDWSLRLRPTKTGQIPPITLVAISDEDIRALGHWPVTDEVLTIALNIVTQHRPRAIGVSVQGLCSRKEN